ncbi:MAG: GNAT family N-acetyltransferase [Hyphomonadaceae bacterium]|nr:GNAT family N-acetyltransferase [Hyphomonadaceae bacterium]
MMRLTHARQTVAGVTVAPLADADSDALCRLAQDSATWTWWPRDMLGLPWQEVFASMMADQAAGRMLHHVVRLAGDVVGMSGYLNIRPEHCGAEIGFTWYAASVRGGLVNPACKLMLLSHAFASGAQRMELKTDALNARSRAALLKLGAQFEGIHRRHMLMHDGRWRDTAWYSVLAGEWPGVEAGLKARLKWPGDENASRHGGVTGPDPVGQSQPSRPASSG